jgi:hypothetical protein
MLRVFAPPEDGPPRPLLPGHFLIHQRGEVPGRPYLAIRAFCRACHDYHEFSCPDDAEISSVWTVPAPCRGTSWSGRELALAPDPALRVVNAGVLKAFAAASRRRLAGARLRHQLAVSRSSDQAWARGRGRPG